MRILVPSLLAVTVLAAGLGAQAAAPKTIPPGISKQMVKGKKLNMVWLSPDFDGSRGIQMGAIKNETEEDDNSVRQYFPLEIGRLTRKDSPYTLELSIVSMWAKSSPTHNAFKFDLEVEGRIVDGSKNVVAAFVSRESSSNGGNIDDCARLVVRAIIFDMTKDLFPADTPQNNPKRSEVIVPAPEAAAPAAPAPAAQDTSVIVPAPAPMPLAPAVAQPKHVAQPVPAPEPAAQLAPAPQPKPAVPPAPQPKPVAAPAPKSAIAPLFSSEIAARMQAGKFLDRVWISQFFDKSKGFALGEVRYTIENRNDGVDQYLPEALREISSDDAPVVLNMRIVDLQTRAQGQAGSMARLGVEGNLVAKDGTVVAAFRASANVSGTMDLIETCRNASRQIVIAITRELK